MTERLLEGNGVTLVRERALARSVQKALERMYRIEGVVEVHAFLEEAGHGERETLFVRKGDDGAIEMSLRIPALARPEFDVARDADLDPLCQIIEGVSHFVYIAHRARSNRESTQLELELQAEVDKYVVLAASIQNLDVARSQALRGRLYESVSFTDDAGGEIGDRYRMANDLAKRFVRRLEQDFILPKRYGELHSELRRFYAMGQEDKLRLARAA